MDRFVAQPFPPALGRFAIARVLLDVRNHPGIEDHLAVVRRVKPTIEVDIRLVQIQPHQLGHTLERLETLGQQHRIRFIDWCHRQRSQHVAVVVTLLVDSGVVEFEDVVY